MKAYTVNNRHQCLRRPILCGGAADLRGTRPGRRRLEISAHAAPRWLCGGIDSELARPRVASCSSPNARQSAAHLEMSRGRLMSCNAAIALIKIASPRQYSSKLLYYG